MFDSGRATDDGGGQRPPTAAELLARDRTDLPLPTPAPYRDALCADIAATIDRFAGTPPVAGDSVRSRDGDGDGPGMPDAQDRAVLDRLEEMGRLIERLEAERLVLLRDAVDSGAVDRDGGASAGSWLRRNADLTAAQAGRRGNVAGRLPDLPILADAFRAGLLGTAHMNEIDRLCRDTGLDNVQAIQEPLLVAARALRDVGEFRRLTVQWRNALRPDFLDERDERNHESRRGTLAATFDGVVHLDARFDAEGGAAVQTAVHAMITPDSPDTPSDQRRTRPQMIADALVDLCRLHLRLGTVPEVAGERPHVTVRIDEGALRGVVGAPAAEIDGVGPVGPAVARRLLADATVTRVVYDSAGQPVDVGTATRVWPSGIRRAITDRDRRCRFPGCMQPPHRCDIDHVVPVHPVSPDAARGDTAVTNGILLCRFHHQLKHPDRWWPTLEPDGAVTWRHPTMAPRVSRPTRELRQWTQLLIEHPDWGEPPDPPDTAGEERATYAVDGRPSRADTHPPVAPPPRPVGRCRPGAGLRGVGTAGVEPATSRL